MNRGEKPQVAGGGRQNDDYLTSGVQVFKDSRDLEEKMGKENLYFVIFLPDLQNTKLYTEYILTLQGKLR